MGEGEARGEGKGGAKEELPPMETNMYREACTILFYTHHANTTFTMYPVDHRTMHCSSPKTPLDVSTSGFSRPVTGLNSGETARCYMHIYLSSTGEAVASRKDLLP